jgi:hypothetical protein
MKMNKEEKKAKESAQRLSKHLGGVPVAAAHGLIDPLNLSGTRLWYLIVWSGMRIDFPDSWEGYPVVRRPIPKLM